MFDNNEKNDYKNKSCVISNPNIYNKFKHWIFSKEELVEKIKKEEALKNKDLKVNDFEDENNDKKVDVSKVSGGNLSIEEQNNKYNFETEEAAKKEIYDRAESGWYHRFAGMHSFDRYKLQFPKLVRKPNDE